MSDLDRIVSVNISRQTKTVDAKGFGSALLLGEESEKPVGMVSRTREYTSLKSLSEDFAETTEIYKGALAYFSPAIKPEKILIGFIQGTETIGEAITAIQTENSSFYGVAMTRIDQPSQEALAEYIETTALIAVVRSNDANILTVNNNVNSTEIVRLINDANPDAGGYDIVINGETVNINQGFSNSQIEDALESLPSIASGATNVTGSFDNDDLSIEFLQAAQFGAVITITNITLTESGTPVNLNLTTDQVGSTSGDDIAKVLKDLNRERTFVIYNSDSANRYIDMSALGTLLPKDVGSYTFNFKTLAGILADTFSDTEISVMISKNVNYYTRIGGVDVFTEGKVASGEYIDNIINVDFIKARMQEKIYTTLVNVDKVPFTNAGADLIVNQMEAVLKNAVDNQILSDSPYPTITRPDVRAVAFADRANRCLPDINFVAVLAGAIHKVEIQGNVTV